MTGSVTEAMSERPVAARWRSWLMTALVVCAVAVVAAIGLNLLRARVRRERFRQGLQDGTVFQARCISNACLSFLSVRGQMPSSLEDLVPDFLPDRRALVDPEHPEVGEIGYFYYGMDGPKDGQEVLLASKAEVREPSGSIQFGGAFPFMHRKSAATPGRRVFIRFNGDGGEGLRISPP